MWDHASVVAAFLIAHFFIFITNRGELPKYKGFLLGG